jgi:hypothetical protein
MSRSAVPAPIRARLRDENAGISNHGCALPVAFDLGSDLHAHELEPARHGWLFGAHRY